MKKSLILGLLGLAVTLGSSLGQGTIALDNYNTGGPNVTYGEPNVPANGVSGGAGTVGSGLLAGWTMGLYYVVGTPVVGSDPNANPIGDPSQFGGLTLASGQGSTASFFTSSATAGQAVATFGFAVPGTVVGGGDTVTAMVVAYNGASYSASTFRGHSAAFTITTSTSTAQSPNAVGSKMATFGVFAVPEPSVFALAGLGGAFLMLIRRKK